MPLSLQDQKLLSLAAQVLDNPGFASKVTKTAAKTVDKTLLILPERLTQSISQITRTSLEKALDSALFTLNPHKIKQPWRKTHQIIVCLSGAAGGSFGLPALAIELPVSTTIMLRSIAEIAHHHGEDINSPETKMACLEVFALSQDSAQKNDSETGYYAIRSLLAKSISDAASRLTVQELSKQSSPALFKLLNSVAARFSIPVSEKIAAQSLPVIGAIGGASINLLFIRYFQEIAEAHFTVRTLEKKYTPELIKEEFKLETNRL